MHTVVVNKTKRNQIWFLYLQDLFFKFPWNNFLHTQVEGCISAALSSTVSLNANEDSSEEPFSMKYHVSLVLWKEGWRGGFLMCVHDSCVLVMYICTSK